MYVWIEAVLGYITMTQKYCQENNMDWEKYWKNVNCKIYMVHGKDNITFIYNSDEIAAHAVGEIRLEFAKSDLEGILQKK